MEAEMEVLEILLLATQNRNHASIRQGIAGRGETAW